MSLTSFPVTLAPSSGKLAFIVCNFPVAETVTAQTPVQEPPTTHKSASNEIGIWRAGS